MRLLITTDTIGGVWRFSHELTKGLLAAGDSVAMVSFGQEASATQLDECERLAAGWGGQFRYVSSDVPLEWMRENEDCFRKGAAILRRSAGEFGAELLHANQFCYGAAELETPAIVTAHSDVLSWARACRSGLLEESEWLRRYRALVQRGLDEADAVTAPTKWMLDALAESFYLAGDKAVIPNGRSLPSFNTPTRVMRAVTAGRLWDEAKDVALLGEVQSPMPLLLVGESECDGTGMAPLKGVEICGSLSGGQLLRLFSETAVYVCTSRYEPFGLAPLEAALCGCAVVARNIASLREVWGSGAIYFNDAGELSAVLTQLANSPGALREAQRRAGIHAQRYTRKRMVDRYRTLYMQLLSNGRVAKHPTAEEGSASERDYGA